MSILTPSSMLLETKLAHKVCTGLGATQRELSHIIHWVKRSPVNVQAFSTLCESFRTIVWGAAPLGMSVSEKVKYVDGRKRLLHAILAASGYDMLGWINDHMRPRSALSRSFPRRRDQ